MGEFFRIMGLSLLSTTSNTTKTGEVLQVLPEMEHWLVQESACRVRDDKQSGLQDWCVLASYIASSQFVPGPDAAYLH